MPAASKKHSGKIKIAVLESDPLRFVGLRTILEREKDFEVTAVDLADVAQHLQSDIVLLGAHGTLAVYEVVASMKSLRADVRIIFSGAPVGDDWILRAVAAGVKGYIDETANADEYTQAIRSVHGGAIWAPARVLAKFIERVTSSTRNSSTHDTHGLSERERQVLELLTAGRTNKEIAGELGIEERTVKSHISRLMQKVGVDNRIALSVHVITHALLKGA